MKSTKSGSDSKKSSKSAKAIENEENPPKSRGRASPSRSPARGRKPSPEARSGRKSPSRKSPSRKSPSRKSPSRKSPSRKSPSRSGKDVDDVPKSPSRRPGIKTESKAEVLIAKMDVTKLAQAQRKLADINGGDPLTTSREGVRERKIKPVDEPSSEMSKIGSRRSIRLKTANENFEKLLSLAQSTKLPRSDRSFETFSDDDDDVSPQKKNKSATRTLLTPTDESKKAPSEFGGRIGVLCSMILGPLFIVAINVACNKSQCSFMSWPNLQQFKHLNVWFSWRAVLVYFSYLTLQCVISLIPCCGKKVTLPDTGAVFRANGLFASTLILITALVLDYFNIPIFHIIYKEYYALMTTALLAGILFSIGTFIKSRKVPDEDRNQYGNTGYFFYDFWMGRELNPVLFGKVNIKLLLLRAALTAVIIVNLTYLYLGLNVKNFPILSRETLVELATYKQMAGAISVNPTLLTFVVLQVLYIVNALFDESSVVSTFDYHSEGTGLMLTLGYSIFPFTTSLINKCILEHNIALNKYLLPVVVAIYLFGLYIYYASNKQKSAFRANPMNPKLAHLDSIPTFHGKRLLVSGWWGFVRHPNYLGDIILHLTWATAVTSEPPVLMIVGTVFLLASRAARDGERCRQRYGAAWERYCRRVPCNLVPKVY